MASNGQQRRASAQTGSASTALLRLIHALLRALCAPAWEAGECCLHVLETEAESAARAVPETPCAELGRMLVHEGAIDGEQRGDVRRGQPRLRRLSLPEELDDAMSYRLGEPEVCRR